MTTTDQVIVPLGVSNWPLYKAALVSLNVQWPGERPERGLLILGPISAKKLKQGAKGTHEAVAGVCFWPAGPMLIVAFPFRRVYMNEARNESTKQNLLLLGGAIKNLAFVEGRTVYGIPWDKNGLEALQMMGMDKNITTLAF